MHYVKTNLGNFSFCCAVVIAFQRLILAAIVAEGIRLVWDALASAPLRNLVPLPATLAEGFAILVVVYTFLVFVSVLAFGTGLVDDDFAVHLFSDDVVRRIRRLPVASLADTGVVRDLPVSKQASASAGATVFVVSGGSSAGAARLRGRL